MMNRERRALILSFIILPSVFCLFLSACGPRRTPDLARIFAATRARTGKPPIIVIPGILGSRLVNRKTGEVVWPSAFRSDTDGLALPLSPDLAATRDDLVPERIVETAKLARLAPEVYIYHELLEALRTHGGDRDTFYVFAYDWRRDNVESARALVRRIEALKAKLGRPDLRFNVIAHSMGGLIARYAARYGDADLPADAAPPTVNLYDPATWRRSRWSPLHEPGYRARYAAGLLRDENVPRPAGDPAALD